MRFSAKLRTKIVLAVTRESCWCGSWRRLQVAIYWGQDDIVLLVRSGKRWRMFQTNTVWDALDLIERAAIRGLVTAPGIQTLNSGEIWAWVPGAIKGENVEQNAK